MLTIPAKKTLKAFQKLTGYTSQPFTFYTGESVFFLYSNNEVSVDLNVYSDELSSILTLLIQEGYIESANGYIVLTQKGIHREYIQWAERKEWLCEKVFTPIVVSFITSVITTLITIWLVK